MLAISNLIFNLFIYYLPMPHRHNIPYLLANQSFCSWHANQVDCFRFSLSLSLFSDWRLLQPPLLPAHFPSDFHNSLSMTQFLRHGMFQNFTIRWVEEAPHPTLLSPRAQPQHLATLPGEFC